MIGRTWNGRLIISCLQTQPEKWCIFAKEDIGASGRAPIGGLRVYINYNNLNQMMSGWDPNTLSHELGHTAGLIHPEDARSSNKWNASDQELNTFDQDNKKNLMWTFRSLEKFGISKNAAISLTSVQLGLMYSNYRNGKLNRQTNFDYRLKPMLGVPNGGVRFRSKSLKYELE